MASKRKHITFTKAQLDLLEKLSLKLGIDPTNVVRLAIARLAEAEDVK